ncbi:cytochrome P450 [Zychaea mexicana]|uniref:cytochrome P450 n=1 Tax=Zychaea mexicana TaxID=64656 RepID=UPI0022FEC902|nr:cytochrome P450 [Zychaea mexicana]KAI9489994.1 cytochrome P450 [Zychaea mexicana]
MSPYYDIGHYSALYSWCLDKGRSLAESASCSSATSSANTEWKSLTTVATVSLVLSTTSYVVWRALRKQQPDSEVKLVSGGIPFIGHALELSRDSAAFIKRCKAERGPAFRINLFGQKVYVVTGSLIPEVYTNAEWYSFRKAHETILPVQRVQEMSYEHIYKPIIAPLDKNPVIYPIQANLKPHNFHLFSKRIQDALRMAIYNHLNITKGEKKVARGYDLTSMIVSQVVCLCFAGRNAGSNQDLVKAMATFTTSVVKAGIVLSLLPDRIAEPIVKRFMSVEHEIDLVVNLLLPELEKAQAGEEEECRYFKNEPTFTSMVLDLPKASGKMHTAKEAAYYFGGAALTSIPATIQFTLFIITELAYRPALVQEIRAEIEKLDERTPETISRIKLLDSIFREVLRYKAASLASPHTTIVEDALLSSGEIIPCGGLVFLATHESHTNQSTMQETTTLGNQTPSVPLDQFDPYRFMLADGETDNDGKLCSTTIGPENLSFGLGKHNCPGRKFAAYKIKYIVAELFMQFNITGVSDERPKDVEFLGTFRSPSNTPLVFERREKQ